MTGVLSCVRYYAKTKGVCQENFLAGERSVRSSGAGLDTTGQDEHTDIRAECLFGLAFTVRRVGDCGR